MALDPENNLNKASENIKQSAEASKEASANSNDASKNIKEASKEIKEAAEVSNETSKTLKEASKGIEESVSNSNSGIKGVISEIKKNNESQENSEETSEENSKKIENLFAPIIKTIQEEKDFFFSLAERQKDWNDYRTVMEGDLIKLKFSELDAEKRMNDQKLKLLEEEEEKIRHMAENYEKTKDLYSPEQQKAMQESFIKAIKDIDSKKKEVKSRGEELETARYEKSFFGKIDKTIEKIGKSLSEAKEKTSLISQVLLGLFMFGLAIQKGLIDGNTIKKILSFVLDMLWRGVKSLVSMIANLTWMAIDGIFSWLESSLIGRIIKGLGVFAGQLNILKLFVKLPGPLMKISNILNIIFGSIGRVLGIMTKVFSFIPFFGKFFKVLDMVFTGIGSIAKIAPAAGQVAKAGGFFAKIFGFVGKFGGLAKGIPVLGQALTVVMLVVDAVRGFVRGFSGPDGSFLKGLRMALSQIISGLTFGLLDFELIDGFLENFYSTMWEFWSWVGNAIAKYYIMLWEIIKAPFVAIGEFFSDFWEIIWDSEKTISEKIYALFGSWWSAVKNMFGSIYTSIKEFVSGITDVFDPVFEFLDNIGANLRNIGVYIWNFIKKIPKMIFDGLKFIYVDLPLMIWNYIKQLPSMIWGGIVGWVSSWFSGGGEEPGGEKGIIGILWDYITGWIGSIFSGAKNLISGAVSWIGDAWGSVSGAVGGAMETAGSWISGAWDSVTGVAGNLVDGVSGAFDKAYDGISSGLSTVGDYASKAWDTITAPIDKLTDGLMSGISTVGDWASSAMDKVGNTLGNLWDNTLGSWFGGDEEEKVEKASLAPMEAVADMIRANPEIYFPYDAMMDRYLEVLAQKEQVERDELKGMVTAVTNTNNNNVTNNNYAGETVIRPTRAVDPSSTRLRNRHHI